MAKSARLSPGITVCWLARPCFTAFCETVAFPSGVLGPVDSLALERFARIWASVAMIGLLIKCARFQFTLVRFFGAVRKRAPFYN